MLPDVGQAAAFFAAMIKNARRVDFLTWQAEFGSTFGVGALGSASVPEPTTALLLVFTAATAACLRRRIA